MNTKTTLVVLMIAIVLGTYFVLFETNLIRTNSSSDSGGTSVVESPGGLPLLDQPVLPAKVRHLTITLGDHAPFVLERQAGEGENDWKQTQPFGYEMIGWKIDELVTNALKLRYTTKIAAKDLKAYELQPPQAVLAIKTGEGKQYILKLGSIAPAGGAYLQLEDGGIVYVVDSALHNLLLDKTPTEFRSTALPYVPFGLVTQVRLQRDDTPITLERATDNSTKWAFTKGATGRASAAAVESLVNTINFASVDKFIADQPSDLARFGLDKPRIVLNVTEQPAEARDSSDETKTTPPTPITHTLKIGSSTDLNDTAYYAMFDDAPVVFTLPQSMVERLTGPVKDLRDARLTPANPADVREVTLKPTDPKASIIHLVKSEGHWVFGEPKPAFELESTSADQLLDAIFKIKANDYVDTDLKDMQKLATISLALAGSDQPDLLTIYAHGEGSLVVQHDVESVGYVVDRKAMAAGLEGPMWYRDRTVLDVPVSDIASIEVERMGKFPAKYELKPDEAGNFADKMMDHNAVAQFVRAIAPLRAAFWPSDEAKLTNPDQMITLTTQDGKQYRIELWSEAMLGRTDAGTFGLNVPTMDTLMAELRDRVVIPLDVEQIDSVTYDLVRITRDSASQITVKGASFGGEQAGKLLDALAGLKAERFVSSDWIPKMDKAHPRHELTIRPHTGKSITLKIWAQGNVGTTWIGQVDDGSLFTLAADPVDCVKDAEK